MNRSWATARVGGAGPVGLPLARTLSRARVPVAVVELLAAPSPLRAAAGTEPVLVRLTPSSDDLDQAIGKLLRAEGRKDHARL